MVVHTEINAKFRFKGEVIAKVLNFGGEKIYFGNVENACNGHWPHSQA